MMKKWNVHENNIIINYYLAINTIHRAIKLKMFFMKLKFYIQYICICMYVCMFVCMYICMHVNVYTHS